MLAIIQTNNDNKEIIGFINSYSDFLKSIKNLLAGTNYRETDLPDEKLRADSSMDVGLYLQKFGTIYNLIEKKKIQSPGFIYNSETWITELRYTWEAVPLSSDFSIHLNREYLVSPKLNLNKYPEFTLDQIPPHGSIVIYGRRNTGKTTKITKILDKFDKDFIKNTIIFAIRKDDQEFYSNKYPGATVVCDFNSELLEKYLNDKPGAFVFDDSHCIKDFINNSFIQDIICHSDKYNKLILITYQYPLKFPQHIMSSIDYILILREEMTVSLKRLFTFYATSFSSFNEFKDALSAMTTNFGCMVLSMKDNMVSKFN